MKRSGRTGVLGDVGYVKGKDAEIIHKWKEFERSFGISATDSAFGSDME